MKTILFFSLLFFYTMLWAQTNSVVYTYPKPGSTDHRSTTSVVVRFAHPVGFQNQTVPVSMELTDSEGILTTIRSTFSRDRKTLTAKPVSPLVSGETYRIRLFGPDISEEVSWTFSVRNEMDRETMEKMANWMRDHGDSQDFWDVSSSEKSERLVTPGPIPAITLDSVRNPAPGEFLFANNFPVAGGYGDYLYVLKNDGNFHKIVPTPRLRVTNFKPLDNGLYTYGDIYRDHYFTGGGAVSYQVIDTSFTIKETFEAADGYEADNHDFLLLPNGNHVFIIYEPQLVDLSSYASNGNPSALVVNSIIQELDPERNVVFMWRSLDYIPPSDSYLDLSGQIVDYTHFNSLDVTPDGHLLVTARTTSELIKINRQTGEIIWRLGGKKNQFTFLNDYDQYAPHYFAYPHDGHFLKNGNILLFDNGGLRPKPQFSRAVEYKLDELNKTATKVWEYRNKPDIYGANQGNAQRLENGNTVICWGSANLATKAPVATEVNAEGVIQAEINAVIGFRSYRVYKSEFINPPTPPSVSINDLVTGIDYEFRDETIQTGVAIRLNSAQLDYNYVKVVSESRPAINPVIFDQNQPEVLSRRIWIEQNGLSGFSASISFDAAVLGIADVSEWKVAYRNSRGAGLFIPVTTVAEPISQTLSISTGSFGEFIFYKQNEGRPLSDQVLLEFPSEGKRVLSGEPVRLRWASTHSVHVSHLQVASDSAFVSLLVNDSTITQTHYMLPPLDNGEQRYWRVRFSREQQKGNWSETRRFSATGPFIDIISPNGNETVTPGKKYFIQWESNDADSVNLFLKHATTGAVTVLVDSLLNTGSWYWTVPLSFQSGSLYKILVSDTNQPDITDSSDASFSVGLSVEGPTDGIVRKFRIQSVYPNPFNPETTLQLQVNREGVYQISVFDMLGRQVRIPDKVYLNRGEQSLRILATDWSSGLYVIRITGDDNQEAVKVVYAR
ncbi:MAG: aryl-sulfate sulfotransferase [Bacteroidetes bacterium]|nr:aryl-sulfate sulfotransferase [Bacteroidota bacterium]